jgi:hypothetical protein
MHHNHQSLDTALVRGVRSTTGFFLTRLRQLEMSLSLCVTYYCAEFFSQALICVSPLLYKGIPVVLMWIHAVLSCVAFVLFLMHGRCSGSTTDVIWV